MIEALEWHADETPDRLHIRLLDESGGAELLTYRELRDRAVGTAAGLVELGVGPGDAVAMMLPTSLAYFTTFVAVLLTGAVPVPIYPPARPSQLADHLRRHARILDNARVSLLVTVPGAVALGQALRAEVPSLRQVVTPDLAGRAGGPPGAGLALPRLGSSDVALLQYTSGSTGQPKGVVLTHANLLANIRAMGEAGAASSADVFVSWLPLYHDMGLIGSWMSSVYYGFPLVLMAPQTFLARPARWLEAIHAHRGTISVAPNFAYELCLTRIEDAELEGLDLGSWRLALNGAEPVGPHTVERFADRFAPYGLHHESISPVYGLAECCVGLAFPPLGRGPLIDRVDRDRFMRSGQAISVGEEAPEALRIVACGQALPDHELRIVDAAGNELDDRYEGRIQFRGPSATSGYYRNPAATKELVRDGWRETGDLGYVAEGDLYVTGRVKDLVIRAGRNLHPEELETALGGLPGIRKGCVAVFGDTDPGGAERLIVLAETRERDEGARSTLRAAIVATTVELAGAPPDDVVLAPPHTVLKTSSGKIRRSETRDLYRAGALHDRPTPAWWQIVRLRARGARQSLLHIGGVAEGWAFALSASLAFGLVALPCLVLIALSPSQQWNWLLVRRAIRLLASLTGTALAVDGLDRLPGGPCLAVSNHQSWLDGFVLAAVLPPSFRPVAGEVLGRQALSGFVLRRLGVEFVERGEPGRAVGDVDRLALLARGGRNLVMFPEGGLARARGLRPFHMGAFVVAARAGVGVVPIAIRGTRSMVRPGHRFVRRGSIEVTVEDAIRPRGTDWAAAVELQHEVRAAVLRCSGEPDLA